MTYLEDIQLAAEYMFDADNIDLQDILTDRPKLIIHWDEIEVSNEEDERHTIYDLYAMVSFTSDYKLIGFKLTRSTLTYDEVEAGYVFSHIPRLTKNLEFSRPCLGDGPIRNTMTSLSYKYDSDLFRLFLVELDRYVRTESLAGGPFIKMREVGNRYFKKYEMLPMLVNSGSDWLNNARSIFEYVKTNKLIIPEKYGSTIWFGDWYSLVIKLSRYTVDYLIKNGKYNKSAVDIYFVKASVNDGIIYTYNLDRYYIAPDDIHINLVFKGKNIGFKIVNTNIVNNDMYVIRPVVARQVISMLFLDYYTNEFEENDEHKEIRP